MTDQTIDIAFPAKGETIPLDHGYAVYAAISKALETPTDQWMHDETSLGIHNIKGKYHSKGLLQLTKQSEVIFRAKISHLQKLMPLIGIEIEIGGNKVRLGAPRIENFSSPPILIANLVTTKNGHLADRFKTEVDRSLKQIDALATSEIGARRVLSIAKKTIIGFQVAVRNLNAESSLKLQEVGLGGRRKMGCGIFVPFSP